MNALENIIHTNKYQEIFSILFSTLTYIIIVLTLSGVQRGCGGCDGPGHPAWGASNDGVFFKKSVGKCFKMFKK